MACQTLQRPLEVSDQNDAMIKQFVGRWKMERVENFDAFLAAQGINFVLRRVAGTLIPTVIFKLEDDQRKEVTWTIRTETIVKSVESLFILGDEFLETTIDGRKVNTTFTVEMVKDEDENEAIALIQRQRDKQGRNIEICRIIRPGHDGRPDNMSVIMTCGSATSRASFYRDS